MKCFLSLVEYYSENTKLNVAFSELNVNKIYI